MIHINKNIFSGVEVVEGQQVSIVVEEVEVSIKEVTKATVAAEVVAEAFNPEDPQQILKKNPLNSRVNTISIKPTKNSKKCWISYR